MLSFGAGGGGKTNVETITSCGVQSEIQSDYSARFAPKTKLTTVFFGY